MAVERISRKLDAYRSLARPGPTPEVETPSVAPVRAVLSESEMRGTGEPVPYTPYINTRGETTGTVINTTA